MTPTVIARSAPSAPPTAQEQLWSPDASGDKSSLQVVSVAKPQPIVAPASSAGSYKRRPGSSGQTASEAGSSGQSPDWLNRVTDLFQFSEKETAPTTPASPSNIAAVGPEEPAAKGSGNRSTFSKRRAHCSATWRPTRPRARSKPSSSNQKLSRCLRARLVLLHPVEGTATTDIGRMFSRIAEVFRPSPKDDSALE